MATKTLWSLPPQQLPETDIAAPVFVTIWFALCLVFAFMFSRLLYRVPRTWPEFRLILIGVALLAFWYFFTMIDRWLHSDRRSAPYGYIIVAPLWEFSRVGSTIYLLWGTYTIVWNELEGRFKKEHQGYWWFAAKCSIFLVCLMSFYYLVLYLALAIVWMRFYSLNTIADIATKRTSFEIAMTAFFMVFGVLTLIATTATIFYKAKRVDGAVRNSRLILWVATLMLLIRSFFEFGMILRVYNSGATRRSTASTSDVAFGFITFIYLGLMWWTARSVASPRDTGNRDHRRIEANIRAWILKQLDQETSSTRRQSPPFSRLLQDLRNGVDFLLDNETLSAGSTMSKEDNKRAAERYIQVLKDEFGRLDPKEGIDYRSRSSPRVPSVLSRKAVGAGRRPGAPQMFASDPNLRHTSRAVSSPVAVNVGRYSAPPNLVPAVRNSTTPGRLQHMSGSVHRPGAHPNAPYCWPPEMETHMEVTDQFEMISLAESSTRAR